MVHDLLINPEMNHPANPSIPKTVTTIAVFLILSVFILFSSLSPCFCKYIHSSAENSHVLRCAEAPQSPPHPSFRLPLISSAPYVILFSAH